jgi:hypothetical protein
MPSTGFSDTTITRNAAPLQGAFGDGRTVISPAFAQLSDALAADHGAVAKSADAPASSTTAFTAATKRRARTIEYGLLTDREPTIDPATGDLQDIESASPSQRN